MFTTPRSRAATAALALTLLAGCGASDNAASTTATSSSTSSPTSNTAGASTAVSVTDPWCKATEKAGAMTGCFATLHNDTDAAIHITGGTSGAAGMVELHETVKNDAGEMQMQPAAGGFTLEPAESLLLEPGGNHIMLMQVHDVLENGISVSATLTSSAGDIPITFVVRTYPGANESYASGSSSS
ncbi:MAG: copper chaperone PCu(A)C [Dermatophilaceae bacterium]